MAGKNRSDVELVISARNEAATTIKEIEKSFNELESGNKKSGSSAEENSRKQALLVDALAKVREAQDKLKKSGSDGEKALGLKSKDIKKLETDLAGLKSEFADYGKKLTETRTPGQYLLDQLAAQKQRFESLGDSIKATKQTLQNAESGLKSNQGVDETASKRISKQREQVIKLGNAWKDTQALVKKAQTELNNVKTDSDNKGQLAKDAKVQLDLLKEQVRAAVELEKARREEVKSSKKASKEQVQAQLAATRSVKKLRVERDEQAKIEKKLSAEARKSASALNTQTKSVDSLVEKAKKQKQAYTDLKTALVEYEKVQTGDGLARQEANIDKLRDTLSRLEKQYDVTGKKIESTQGKIAKASGPSASTLKKYEQLKQKIAETEQSIKSEVTSLSKLEQKLKQAGANSEGLERSQARLAGLSERITREQKELEEQYGKTGAAAGKAGKEAEQAYKRIGGNGSRQSLSYLQRIRGEMLSIAATYTGLYAVGDGIRSIYDASVLTQKATARLSSVFSGDMNAVGQEIQFVRDEADRLGLEFETLLDEYTKFVTNVPEGTLSLEQMRYTFSGIAETARVVGLSTEDVKATFKALSQIASKGALQMEELKGQLGERIPKAVESAAKGLNQLGDELITTDILLKRINNGEVTSDAIVAIASALRDEFGSDLPKALESPQTAVADFKNSLFEFREELSRSGFFDVLIQSLTELTKEMKKPEFQQGMKDFAGALAGVAEFVVELIKNFSQLKPLFIGLISAKAIGSVVKFGKGIFELNKAISGSITSWGKYNSGLERTRATMKTVVLGAGQLTAAFTAGFGIGTWLQQTFPAVEKFGIRMVGWFEKTKAYATSFFSTGLSPEKDLKKINDQIDQMLNDVDARVAKENNKSKPGVEVLKKEDAARQTKEFTDEITKGLNFFRGNFEFDELKDAFDDVAEELESESADTLQKRLKLIEKEYSEFLTKIDKFQSGSNDEILKIQIAAAEKVLLLQQKAAAGDVDRVRAAKEIKSIQERERKEVENLRKQQQALSQASAKTNDLIEIKKKAETEKFYSDQLKEEQEKINNLVTDRKNELARINELEELGLITIEEKAVKTAKVNDESLSKIRQAVDASKELAINSGNTQLESFADGFDNFSALERRKALTESLRDAEAKVNEIIAVRDSKIQAINNQRDLGNLSAWQAENAIRDVTNETNDNLQVAVDKAQTFADALKDPAVIANLDAIEKSIGKVGEELVNADDINQQFASGMTNAIDSWISGAQSAKDAFKQFFADFLKQIAQAIIQAVILRSISGALGFNLGGAVAGGVNPPVLHDGGVVGKDGGQNTRMFPAWLFTNAVRYHTGGIAGLKPDEVPAILQKGEQVIPRDQVGKQTQSSQNIKIVNAIDSSSVVEQGINSSSGQKAILNFMRANKSQVRSVLS